MRLPWCAALSVGLMLAAMGVCLATRGSALGAFAAASLATASVVPALAGGRSRISPIRLHRALGGITMAALAVVMSTMGVPVASGPGHVAGAHATAAHSISLHAVVLALVVAQTALSLHIVRSTIRRQRPIGARWSTRSALHLGEVAVMAAGTGLMLSM